MRGTLFILSAPSGAGKTTLIRSLLGGPFSRLGEVAFAVSHTTRTPRTGETDGVEYHFVEPAAFQAMDERGEFLERATVHGNLYGTSRREVFPRLDEGRDVLLDIDVQGAEKVMAACPEAVSIFILPPSFADLERRLRGRGLDDGASIDRRLDVSLSEIECYRRYQYVIVNREAAGASEALAAIVLDKRCRRQRMEAAVESVLRDFRRHAGSVVG